MLDGVAPVLSDRDQLKKFLQDRAEPERFSLLKEASGKIQGPHPRHHIQVLARAALLLRLSSGALALLLKRTNTTRAEVRFWCEAIGQARGFWEPASAPDRLADLWGDVEPALEQILAWRGAVQNPPSWTRFRREQLTAIAILAECERIGLWGMGV